MQKINEQTEPYQRKICSKHRKMKIRLVGRGGNRFKSAPFNVNPNYNRSKSAPAPAMAENVEIEEDKLIPRKKKIKVKMRVKK
jgi:hypothetical protein